MIHTLIAVDTGFVALMDNPDTIKVQDLTPDDVSIKITDYGISINVKELIVVIPEALMDYLMQNKKIVIYRKALDEYVAEPLFIIELPEKALVEAKIGYLFLKKRREKENASNTQVEVEAS